MAMALEVPHPSFAAWFYDLHRMGEIPLRVVWPFEPPQQQASVDEGCQAQSLKLRQLNELELLTRQR